MSQTALFVVGLLVFALTIWGVVMAGGIWLGHVIDDDDNETPTGPPAIIDLSASPVDGTPTATS